MFSLKDYLTLVDETGLVIRDDKRGAINGKTVNILARHHIRIIIMGGILSMVLIHNNKIYRFISLLTG